MWKELAQEYPEVFDHCVEQTLWNTTREREMSRPLTQVEEMQRHQGVSHKQIAQNRLWNKRPDGIAFKIPTTTKVGAICLLEFNRMSDVTNYYVVMAKREVEGQYESLRSSLGKTMQHQGWMVEQVSFISGVWSLNEEELKKNLEYFKVPSVSLDPIKSKLGMKTFDEYANILKGMYSIQFNGRSDHGGTPTRPALGPSPPLINSLTTWQSNKVRKHKEGEK